MKEIEQKPMVKKGYFEINWPLAMKAPAAQKKKEAGDYKLQGSKSKQHYVYYTARVLVSVLALSKCHSGEQ